MIVTRYITPVLALCALIITTGAYASAGGWVITLSNGGTLTANGCKAEGGRLHLTYPVGEAYIPMESVRSVKHDGAPVELFQSRGVFTPHADEKLQDNSVTELSGGPALQPVTGRPVNSNQRSAATPGRTGTMRAADILPATRFGLGTAPSTAGHPAVHEGAASGAEGWFTAEHSYEVDEIIDQSEYLSDDELNQKLDALFPTYDNYTGADAQ